MVEHVSAWIGEEKLTGPEYDGPTADPLKVHLRSMKRSVCVTLMEQMTQYYANDKPCICYERKADCDCITIKNGKVPLRVSKLDLMAYRLYFGSSSNNLPLPYSMRMQQTRVHWMNTDDLVCKRNAALLKLKTKNWGEDADKALTHLANLLEFDVVQTETEARSDLFDDSDDENVAYEFENMGVGANRSNSTQAASAYDVSDGSIAREIQKFLKQKSSHFVDCKFVRKFALRKDILRFVTFDIIQTMFLNLNLSL